MKPFDFFRTYQSHIRKLLATHDEDRAMALAVGGEFETMGILEASLLKQHGLLPSHTLIERGVRQRAVGLPAERLVTGPIHRHRCGTGPLRVRPKDLWPSRLALLPCCWRLHP